MKKKHQDKLQKRCKLKEKGKLKVKEGTLQRIKAKTAKINNYQQRVSRFQLDRFFRNNEGRIYKQIDGSKEGEEIVIPGAQEAKTFWTDIWGQKVEHNKYATWLREIKKDINAKNKQARVQIWQEKLKKQIEADSKLEGPWTRWGPGALVKEFYQLI